MPTPFIPDMVRMMKDKGLAYESEGALVVDVKEESDTAPIPPCIILKSDGSAIYETTDLATLVQRERDFRPDRVMYVVDKRQALHFERVFRCARKTGVTRPGNRTDVHRFRHRQRQRRQTLQNPFRRHDETLRTAGYGRKQSCD